jgi:predicted CXXCH cytochrome family protein
MSKWQLLRIGGTGPSRLATIAAGLVVAVAGIAVSTPASAQITGTRHNLGSLGTGVNKFSGTAEICVFCHTPHGADTTAVVPLWNRTLVGQTYQTYDALGTSTLQGKVAPVGSVSIACLSCHDGTQAMNSVINAPGSGLTNAAFTAGTWTGANQTAGKLIGVANIGTDLRNDHPVGIQYAGGGYTTGALTGPGADPDFRAANSAVVGGVRAWWVDSEVAPNNARNKTDMILYTRTAFGTTTEPFVECASCHDPHTATTMFLRTVNDNSRVCLSCHIK